MKAEDKQAELPALTDEHQRLRDRTDELELIISGLTIFALFALPGWLFGNYSAVYTHLSTALVIAGTVGIALLTGVSYGLGACFVVHLLARAYWVGLIGLRTVFPDGIKWSRTAAMGPLTKRRLYAILPDLDTVIQRTDRLASSLFAVISLITLSILWIGTIMLVTLVAAGAIGGRFGLTNAGIGIGTVLLVSVFGGIPLLLWVMDAVLAARFPRLTRNRFYLGIVNGLGRVSGLVYPQRLILPVQLTLQSNTRPVLFYIALITSITVFVLVGNARFGGWQNFTLSGEFSYLDTEDVADGFRSTYYEDMGSPKDRLRAWPRIDSFNQSGSFVRLFLPYQPLRDNLVLDQLCTSAAETGNRVDCLRQLWSVSIDGRPVPMAGFEAAERNDISMRGLIGLVSLAGLEPGLRRITVVWNAGATESDTPVDDRYEQINRTFFIPFAFAPGYELQME